MEKPLKTIIAILLVLCFTGTCSCGVFPQVTSSSVTSTSVPSEKSGLTVTTAPTPIPTYAPGTELCGMLSVTGDVLIEPKYEYLDLFSEEGLARFEDHGLWGFLNAHGEEVIPAQYEDANNFSEGLAAIKVDGRYGFIDTTGEMVIEPQFEGVEYGFRYGRCVITLNDLQGLIDLDGKVIVEPKYSSIAFPCRDYIMVMEGEDRYGVIDQDGNVVLDMQNSVVGNVDENGYIFFFIEKNTDECVTFEKITDTSGQVEYSVRDQDVIFFSDYIYTPYICASTNNDTSMGVFDLTTGQFVTEEIYTNLWFEGEASEYTFARKETRVGVLDSASGKPILEIKYQWVKYSPDGQFSAFTDEQSCIVFDYSGKFVFETEKGNLLIEYLDQFNCWLYSNDRDHQYGLINTQGEIVFSSEFEFSWLHDKAPSAKEYTPFMLLDYRPGGATPYVTEAENCYSFIGNDYSLVKRGPYTELIGYAGQSGILIGIDEAQHSEVLDVRGTLLFSSDKPIEFVTGNAEYFVYRQAID